MALDLDHLPEEVLTFLTQRHLATLTTLRADGSPHVVPVGFGYDPDQRLVQIITAAGSVKARNAARGGRAAVSQVDGPRWLTLEGQVSLATSPEDVAAGEAAYARRYQQPRDRTDRAVILIAVDKMMGRG
jgi:F420H(2)-dependent biliverdin reductase